MPLTHEEALACCRFMPRAHLVSARKWGWLVLDDVENETAIIHHEREAKYIVNIGRFDVAEFPIRKLADDFIAMHRDDLLVAARQVMAERKARHDEREAKHKAWKKAEKKAAKATSGGIAID